MTRIIAPGKPTMAGTVRGIYGANEPWNAASSPFWGRFNEVEVGSLGLSV